MNHRFSSLACNHRGCQKWTHTAQTLGSARGRSVVVIVPVTDCNPTHIQTQVSLVPCWPREDGPVLVESEMWCSQASDITPWHMDHKVGQPDRLAKRKNIHTWAGILKDPLNPLGRVLASQLNYYFSGCPPETTFDSCPSTQGKHTCQGHLGNIPNHDYPDPRWNMLKRCRNVGKSIICLIGRTRSFLHPTWWQSRANAHKEQKSSPCAHEEKSSQCFLANKVEAPYFLFNKVEDLRFLSNKVEALRFAFQQGRSSTLPSKQGRASCSLKNYRSSSSSLIKC